MGYRIQYGETMTKEFINEAVCKKKVPVITWILIGSFMLAFILGYRIEGMREFLIPGNPDVTEAAVNAFVEDVREGEPIGEAITAFCLEIIENANIS